MSKPKTQKSNVNAVRAFQEAAGAAATERPVGHAGPSTVLAINVAQAKTQREKATVILRYLGGIPGLETANNLLRDVVDAAQNDPPLGVSDGSVSPTLFEHLRCALDGLHAFNRAIEPALHAADAAEARAKLKPRAPRT